MAARHDVIVILGAGLGLALRRRVAHGARLFHEGKAGHLIVTGGAIGTRPTEAEAMRALALEHGVPEDRIIIEDKASGQSLIQDLRAETRLPVIALRPEADKLTRMSTASPAIEAGRVFLPEVADWLEEYEAEMAIFPNGAHDDQVDMTSQFLRWATAKRRGSPRLRRL